MATLFRLITLVAALNLWGLILPAAAVDIRSHPPEDIRQALVEIYGHEIIASPPFHGLGTVTWIGVAAIFLGGFATAELAEQDQD